MRMSCAQHRSFQAPVALYNVGQELRMRMKVLLQELDPTGQRDVDLVRGVLCQVGRRRDQRVGEVQLKDAAAGRVTKVLEADALQNARTQDVQAVSAALHTEVQEPQVLAVVHDSNSSSPSAAGTRRERRPDS